MITIKKFFENLGTMMLLLVRAIVFLLLITLALTLIMLFFFQNLFQTVWSKKDTYKMTVQSFMEKLGFATKGT